MIRELQAKLPAWGFKWNSPDSPRCWIFCQAPADAEKPLETLANLFERVEISTISDTHLAFPLESAKLK